MTGNNPNLDLVYKIRRNPIYLLSRYRAETKFWHKPRAKTLLQISKMCHVTLNPKLDIVNIKAYIKFVKFCQFVLEMSRNEMLTSIKGHNSVTNSWKITGNNPKLDRVNMNAYIKFGEGLSICSPYINRKPAKFWGISRAITYKCAKNDV